MTTGDILGKIRNVSALIVGDICLDRWCTYDPDTAEASRETGIPRTGVISSEVTPGAAGTVANNMVALGVNRVMLLGAIGDDGFGYELTRELGRRGISAELSVKSPDIQTFTYTKLLNSKTGEEDLPRIDFIRTSPLPENVEQKLVQNLKEFVPLFDVVLVSDQAETNSGGVVTPAMREAIEAAAREHRDKIFWVDSRMRLEHFRNVIIKPNHLEAEAASRRCFGRVDFQALLQQTAAQLMLVTHGGEGVKVIEPGKETWVRTKPVPNPVDICGAGDSFSAGAAAALAVSRSAVDAARFGNQVASITIMKKGTGTASPEEVLAAARDWPE